MNARNFKALTIATLAGATLASCGLMEDLDYTVEPSPLEMHGDKVAVTIKAKVPEKGLNKKATVDLTPKIVWDGGEKTLKTMTLRGPDAAGNGEMIPKAGKEVTYTDMIDYQPEFENATLEVDAIGKKGSKTAEANSGEIAKGTIVTPLLLIGDDKVILGADAFKRVTNHSMNGVINYTVNNSTVRGGELKDKDIKALAAFITEAVANEKITLKSMDVSAYASPEGEISLNNNLATERAESAAAAIDKYLKKAGLTININKVGKGEDWEGFKQMMTDSDIADKELILRVLQMYSDVTKREQEIKNLAKTYREVEDKILPKLRRSQIMLNYELVGKSDQEITALANANPDSLTVEELLFAATLNNDMNGKLKIYQDVSRIYASDWRGPNNVGYILMLQNKLNDAATEFEKAAAISPEPEVHNNLGVVARLRGDSKKAVEHYGQAVGAGPEVDYNMGIVEIQKGNYEEAITKMGDNKTFNAALAKVLNGDTDGALSTIDASPEKETAAGYYLKAVIGARTSNQDMVINNLKSALLKDGSLKSKAKNDLEFLKYREVAGFTAMVN